MTYSPTTWVNNSTPAISADNLNKIETGLEYIHGVATVAALRLEPAPTSVTTIRTLGCNSAGDGGGGLWRWDATSTDSDNTGTVVLPTGHVGAGRWVRLYSDGVFPEWFGAAADGVTDDSAAINNALAVNNKVKLTQGATYAIESAISIDQENLVIEGEGAGIIGNGASNVFEFSEKQ